MKKNQKKIYGNNHKCKICEDYDLCTSCYEKGSHKEHSFEIVKPWDNVFKDWYCSDCKTKEIKEIVFGCKECSKESYENKNIYAECLKCEPKHSKTHTLIEYSAKEIVTKRTFQINEIKSELKFNLTFVHKFNVHSMGKLYFICLPKTDVENFKGKVLTQFFLLFS